MAELFIANFEYKKAKDDELNLRAGDEIMVLDKTGGDWWFGRKLKDGSEVSFKAGKLISFSTFQQDELQSSMSAIS